MKPRLDLLTHQDVSATRDLIADVVLEFYSDLEFLPKTRNSLLEYYGKIGYLDDIADFESVYSRENGAFLVLKDAEGIHGCGGLHRLDVSRGELVRLWLKKELRGMGYGRLIFDRLMRTALEAGYKEIFLDTSHRCEAAIAMFRKNGFRDCGSYKESIGDVYMRKALR
ncbi:MAG: GNAT family N-acetyltransferase [Fibrobacterota bacterium]|nr:GNAT family N-acetyltransferase [Fibrobacterota bacterium]